ncbi:MAG: 4-oxalocrotonate tautomerase [Firmicutes bacterium HGW-Firmicutes-12]|jgi:4-oxalocrotonate tautomerase|nr:MAG: 4-oxalocrotonate tautomerase [Firmicutes bacterium HGW-Firmicutes-12]
MPVITIEGAKMSKEQKAKLVKEVVQKASEIMNVPEQAFVTLIRENDFDNVGNGTMLLSEKYAK